MSAPDKIKAQFACGLISASEARDKLARLSKQAEYNAGCADTLPEFKRWTRVQNLALAARGQIR